MYGDSLFRSIAANKEKNMKIICPKCGYLCAVRTPAGKEYCVSNSGCDYQYPAPARRQALFRQSVGLTGDTVKPEPAWAIQALEDHYRARIDKWAGTL